MTNKRQQSREERVLRLRFGISTKSEHTTEEIQEHLKVTRDEIRKIENRVLRKLGRPLRPKILKDLVERNQQGDSHDKQI